MVQRYSGVFQGTVVGFVLFSLYIIDTFYDRVFGQKNHTKRLDAYCNIKYRFRHKTD